MIILIGGLQQGSIEFVCFIDPALSIEGSLFIFNQLFDSFSKWLRMSRETTRSERQFSVPASSIR